MSEQQQSLLQGPQLSATPLQSPPLGDTLCPQSFLRTGPLGHGPVLTGKRPHCPMLPEVCGLGCWSEIPFPPRLWPGDMDPRARALCLVPRTAPCLTQHCVLTDTTTGPGSSLLAHFALVSGPCTPANLLLLLSSIQNRCKSESASRFTLDVPTSH